MQDKSTALFIVYKREFHLGYDRVKVFGVFTKEMMLSKQKDFILFGREIKIVPFNSCDNDGVIL
jgi:hypothetical protein